MNELKKALAERKKPNRRLGFYDGRARKSKSLARGSSVRWQTSAFCLRQAVIRFQNGEIGASALDPRVQGLREYAQGFVSAKHSLADHADFDDRLAAERAHQGSNALNGELDKLNSITRLTQYFGLR